LIYHAETEQKRRNKQTNIG